jgi:3-oxoacyl-[acyl-carrier protein] reductase
VERIVNEIARYSDLAGRVAIVTGGSKGIGEATSRQLVENQVSVAVVARGGAAVDALVSELRDAGANAIGVIADCTSRKEVESMVATVRNELGPPDICMTFAGGFSKMTPILDISDEEWHHVVHSNLTSTFLTVQAVLPSMIELGRGSIITMASNAGRLIDMPLTASYAAAKAAIVMFTRHVALEVGPNNIRLNTIAPATTLTDRVADALSSGALERAASMSPLGRIGKPEDSASVAIFLASDAASWLTGITVDVAGGRIML